MGIHLEWDQEVYFQSKYFIETESSTHRYLEFILHLHIYERNKDIN